MNEKTPIMALNPLPPSETFKHCGKDYRVVILSGKVKQIKLESLLGEGYEEARISFIPLSSAVTMNVIVTNEK